MLIAIALFVVGAIIGWRRAALRGGNTADKLQYALAHGIPSFLVGLLAVVIAARAGWI